MEERYPRLGRSARYGRERVSGCTCNNEGETKKLIAFLFLQDIMNGYSTKGAGRTGKVPITEGESFMANQRRAEERRLRPRFSAIDGLLTQMHSSIILAHPVLTLVASIAVYAAIILLFGERLAISGNYFVILPVLAAALAFELPGGIVAGFLGLPANLILFAAIGHPEFSPASKPIAELSGIVIGTALGYLADYFSKLEEEIARRIGTEEELRQVLVDKETLLRELHHRVRNNLNIIKSLVQLQKNRSSDPAFLAAADDLLGRVFAISLAHEQLYGGSQIVSVDLASYIASLVSSIELVLDDGTRGIDIVQSYEIEDTRIPADFATPLGLIVNEALTNARKHAFGGIAEPMVAIGLSREGDEFILSIEDNGVGLKAQTEKPGLGLTLISALSRQVGGTMIMGGRTGPEGDAVPGTRFELRFRNEARKKSQY
jgi:two-component sensor histidine kinase